MTARPWLRALIAGATAAAVVVVQPPTRAEPAELVLVSASVLSADGRLEELAMRSGAVPGVELKVRVLLPTGYDDPANATVRYPMLLLLHGNDDSASAWTTKTDVATHPAASDLIVVMPDGGAHGFYSDWRDGPQWETFHVRQLLPWIDAHYRTVGSREGRAIAGDSIGGFGSMVYATRHPDLFVAAASFSGVVDPADGHLAAATALQLLGFTPERIWGPFLTDEVTWRDHNPPDLATNLGPMAVGLWTGNGVPNPANGDRLVPAPDPVEAAIYTMNTLAHVRFTQQGVAHEYHDYGPGTHEWHHWERALHEWLPTLHAVLADPPPPAPTFRYRTAEPSFDVWGWSFDAERAVKEFVDLTDVSPAGLTATGSGLLHVRTPPVYEPRATYVLTTDGEATSTSVADETGRLAFSVDLGPSHTAQQYTAEATAAAAVPGYWVTRSVEIEPATPAAVPGGTTGEGAGDGRSQPGQPPATLPATGRDVPPMVAIVLALTAGLALRLACQRAGVRPSAASKTATTSSA